MMCDATGNRCISNKLRNTFDEAGGFLFVREELKEQLEKKKKGSRALADFEDKMNDVRLWLHT